MGFVSKMLSDNPKTIFGIVVVWLHVEFALLEAWVFRALKAISSIHPPPLPFVPKMLFTNLGVHGVGDREGGWGGTTKSKTLYVIKKTTS